MLKYKSILDVSSLVRIYSVLYARAIGLFMLLKIDTDADPAGLGFLFSHTPGLQT